ncbi:hypothetical protein FOFC_02746 [Fusarium oxysporum]|nr:hypothetical protein FOFC_02746 [Fusarium oxysporum]
MARLTSGSLAPGSHESTHYDDHSYNSDDASSGDESCCDGQPRDYTFYTQEKIQDAVDRILSQALEPLQQFLKTTGSSAPLDGPYHFKCPFYASNTEKYRLCLARHDLRSVEDVNMHLVRYHMRIPYCPKCSKTFETVAKCNTHIKGKCKAGPLRIPDGINYYQKSQLENKTKSKEYTGLRPEQRWKYIYKLVFPESQSYPSATMDTEGEKRVLQARVFWQAQGRKYVTEYCQTGSGFEIEDVQELYKACLHALVEYVVDQKLMFRELGWMDILIRFLLLSFLMVFFGRLISIL